MKSCSASLEENSYSLKCWVAIFSLWKWKKKREIPSIVRGLKFDIMFLDCNIYNFEAVILLNKCILSITFSHMHMDISIMVQHKTLFKISAFGLDKLAIRI